MRKVRPWKHRLALLAIAALAGASIARVSDAPVLAQEKSRSEQMVEEPVKIRMIAADQTFTAVLEDSEPARDFAALLPVELVLSDYNRTEKIADLPRRLSTEGAPDGIDPMVGDIAYYAPWGNLAIFYRSAIRAASSAWADSKGASTRWQRSAEHLFVSNGSRSSARNRRLRKSSDLSPINRAG